jgi:hypothetical protein
MRRVCAFALVALLSLASLSSAVLAQTVLTVTSATGQLFVAPNTYSTFNGAFESFVVDNPAPVTSATPGEANLHLTCAKGIKVLAPASGCLSQLKLTFYVQVEEQNTAGININTPCTVSFFNKTSSSICLFLLLSSLCVHTQRDNKKRKKKKKKKRFNGLLAPCSDFVVLVAHFSNFIFVVVIVLLCVRVCSFR